MFLFANCNHCITCNVLERPSFVQVFACQNKKNLQKRCQTYILIVTQDKEALHLRLLPREVGVINYSFLVCSYMSCHFGGA